MDWGKPGSYLKIHIFGLLAHRRAFREQGLGERDSVDDDLRGVEYLARYSIRAPKVRIILSFLGGAALPAREADHQPPGHRPGED